MVNLDTIKILRFTHMDNIPHILKYGITGANSPNKNIKYINIGDNSLISRRAQYPNLMGIPFYFWHKMPMLYTIQKGYSGVTKQSPENIVYIVTTVKEIINHNINFVFTNGHGFNHLSGFYDKSHIDDINNIIDMDAIKSAYWNEGNDTDKKRRKQAEFIVKDDIPLSAIRSLAVYNNNSYVKLQNIGCNVKVEIRGNWFFR